MLYRWDELIGHALDNSGVYRLRALEQVCPDRARFATCLVNGKRGFVDVYRVDANEAREYLDRWEAIRAVKHPNLLAIVDFGQTVWQEQTCVFVITERPDTTLAAVLDDVSLVPEEARDVTLSVLSCLEDLHRRGWVHGEIGPETVVAVGNRTKLVPNPVRRAAAEATPADDLLGVGRLIVAMFGDAGFPLPDPGLNSLVATCLAPDPNRRPTAEEALGRLRETGQPVMREQEVEQRKMLWAATAIVMTLAVVLVLRTVMA